MKDVIKVTVPEDELLAESERRRYVRRLALQLELL